MSVIAGVMRFLGIAWLMVAVAAAASLVSAQETTLAQASVRSQLLDDSGRLILDWGRTPAPAITIDLSDTLMVLRFDRPVALDTAALRTNLKAYFRSAELAADGMSLALPLKKPVTYRSRREDGRFTLDLGLPSEMVFDNDRGAPASAAAPSPAQAPVPAAPPAQASAEAPLPPEMFVAKPFVPDAASAPQVTPQTPPEPAGDGVLRLRAGEHGTYSRLALDWPDVAFTTRQAGDRLEVTFDRSAQVDLGGIASRVQQRLVDISAGNDAAGNLVLRLQLKPNVAASSFRNGATIVVDLSDATATAAAEAAPAAPAVPAEMTPAVDVAPAEEAVPEAKVAEVPATPPAAAVSEGAGSPPIPVPALETAPPSGNATGAPTLPAAEIATPVVVTKEPAVTPSGQPPAPVAIAASATPADGGVILAFTFPAPTGLALFKRGEALWLVFDRPGPVDLATLVRAAPVLTGLGRVETPYATALRLPDTARLGGSNMGAAIGGDGRNWQISLGTNRSLRPTSGMEQRRESLANGGVSLLFEIATPGTALELADPEAGDRVAVVPVGKAGMGLAEAAAWPDFRLLASFQGVAVVPISERTRVESLPNGVVVTTRGDVVPQLVAETVPPPLDPADEPLPADGAAPPAELVIAPVKGLFDLPAWRRGGEATFVADEAALRESVKNASAGQKPDATLALAEFQFAHARYAEALEALAELDGADLQDTPLVSTLRGAANALMDRREEALADLDRPALANVPEAELFRGYLAARNGDWSDAAAAFGGPLPDIDDYAKPTRMMLRRAAAEAQVTEGDPLTAQTFLDSMRIDAPDAEDQAYHDYLSGHQQMRMGDKEAAMTAWRKLADSPVPEVRARSQFDLAELELDEGLIDQKQAAAALEALRFVWRGTDFEFTLLRRLGEHYIASDQPRRGLTTLRQAATNFPSHPEAKAATDAMAETFRDLYLGNAADRLSPLMAVALYDEFRELTPSGAEGDRMITVLADRLVKVDLLDSAGQLLENQVTKRLSGLDKAKAGTRWAAVALLDGKPDLALTAIKESELPEMPPELVAQRRRLQGRALFEVGDTLQGLAMIRDDNSLDGLWLKADLQWRLREWPAAAAALDRLIAAEAARLQLDFPAPLSSEDVAEDPALALTIDVDQGAQAAERDRKFTESLAPLILNQATALSLANDRAGLRRLGRAHGTQMAKGPYATAFATLTAPSSSLADSISAAMDSVDQLGAFVEDYRTRLRAASLSSPAEPSL